MRGICGTTPKPAGRVVEAHKSVDAKLLWVQRCHSCDQPADTVDLVDIKSTLRTGPSAGVIEPLASVQDFGSTWREVFLDLGVGFGAVVLSVARGDDVE